jgi:hypothetical protein
MKTIIDKNTGKEITISDESYESLFPQKKKRWKPDLGKKYYFVSITGDVVGAYMDDHGLDNFNYHTFNMFKTKQEAEAKLKAIKKKYDIINRIEELNDGWEPDWYDDDLKYCLVCWRFSSQDDWFVVNCSKQKEHPDEFYFRSKEIGEQLISEFGDDLKYLFTL